MRVDEPGDVARGGAVGGECLGDGGTFPETGGPGTTTGDRDHNGKFT